MRRAIFLSALLIFLFVPPPIAHAAQQTYTPVADTTLKRSDPAQSFGSATTLDVLYDSGADAAAVPNDVQESYLKFDISSIPKSMYITAAKLTLTGSGSSASGYADVRVRQVTSQWDESNNWDTRPTSATGSVANAEVDNNTFPAALDITKLVQQWYAQSVPNDGIMVRVFGDASYETGLYDYEDVHISSREGANPPQLVVTYSSTPPTPTPTPTASTRPTSSPGQTGSNAPGANTSAPPGTNQSPQPAPQGTAPAPPSPEPLAACISDIHNLTVQRSTDSLDFHFTTLQPVIGRIYFYQSSKTVPPNKRGLAVNITDQTQSYKDTQAGLNHRFLLQGLLPNTSYYVTLFAGANQDCEHAVGTRGSSDTLPTSLATKLTNGSLQTALAVQKIAPTLISTVFKATKALVTANKPVSPLVWASIFFNVLILLTLGAPTVVRLQRWYILWRNMPNRWAYLTRKKKDRGTWGRVMSSLTMKSIQGAMISLYQGDDKKLIDRTFSDDRGLYGFFADPGRYHIVAEHGGFVFPPVLMPFAYQGGEVKVEGTNGTVHLDVVMDPALLTDTRLQSLEETVLHLELYRIPGLIIVGLLSLAALAVDLAPFSVVPVALVGAFGYWEYQRRNEAHTCFTFTLPDKNEVTFAQVVFRTAQSRVVLSKVINNRGKLYATLPAGTYFAEVTTFPIPGRSAILHNTLKIELKPGRRTTYLTFAV